MRFVLNDCTAQRYEDAQIDDYQGLARRHFAWSPPIHLGVRARFSHSEEDLRGTAGFGFWNDPFLMTSARLPTLPRAVWFFFGSPPSDIRLDLQVPGQGWKAATIDALRPASLLLGLVALPAALLMNVRPLYRALWPHIQQAINVQEARLHVDMAEWHTYEIEWGAQRTRFRIDGETLAVEAPSPRGPLGFVLWMDNQYMIAAPWGRFGWGLLEIPDKQWLEVERVELRAVS
jgi:hypothetical protein